MFNILVQGPLILHTTKLYPSNDATVFHALGRVMSGTGKSAPLDTMQHNITVIPSENDYVSLMHPLLLFYFGIPHVVLASYHTRHMYVYVLVF